MRFHLTHKLATYLLVASSVATAMVAGLLTTPTVVALALAAVPSWWADPSSPLARAMDRRSVVGRLPVVGLVGFLAYTVYEIAAGFPGVDLAPVLRLVVVLTGFKLYQRRANRDYVQIYVLSFLLVLAAAAAAQTVFFAVAFGAFVVLSCANLALVHLRREMEENYLVKQSGKPSGGPPGNPAAGHTAQHRVGVGRVLSSRRVVGGWFLAATGGVGALVFLGSLLAFAFVPRVGAGFVLASQRSAMVGFSDEVALGAPGFLSMDNDAVALRAVVPRIAALPSDRAREAELDLAYWRGTVYDSYDRGRWLRSRRDELRTVLDEVGTRMVVREPHTHPGERPAAVNPAKSSEPANPAPAPDDRTSDSDSRQEIDLVGVSAPIAFALDHPVAFELPPPKIGTVPDLTLIPRWSGEVTVRRGRMAGFHDDDAQGSGQARVHAGAHYIAYSRDPFQRVSAAAGRSLAEVPRAAIAPYLMLPPDLASRLAPLVASITAGHDTPAAKVVAVVQWLGKTHRYSLDVRRSRNDVDPVEDFLFHRPSGNCEYFASAAALLLRAAQVPTRYVNGFLGGEWNAVGQHVTVRQNRAHSWVEAYLGELGWMRVDATPSARATARMGRLRQLIDSVEFFWNRWVLRYDLGQQIEIVRRLLRSLDAPPTQAHAQPQGPRRVWPVVLLKAAILVAGAAAWVLLYRRRAGRRRPGAMPTGGGSQPVARLYRRCLERLAERGLPRAAWETPRELSRRVLASGVAGAEDFASLTELYVQARFGGREIEDRRITELARRLNQLGTRAEAAAKIRPAV